MSIGVCLRARVFFTDLVVQAQHVHTIHTHVIFNQRTNSHATNQQTTPTFTSLSLGGPGGEGGLGGPLGPGGPGGLPPPGAPGGLPKPKTPEGPGGVPPGEPGGPNGTS